MYLVDTLPMSTHKICLGEKKNEIHMSDSLESLFSGSTVQSDLGFAEHTTYDSGLALKTSMLGLIWDNSSQRLLFTWYGTFSKYIW